MLLFAWRTDNINALQSKWIHSSMQKMSTNSYQARHHAYCSQQRNWETCHFREQVQLVWHTWLVCSLRHFLSQHFLDLSSFEFSGFQPSAVRYGVSRDEEGVGLATHQIVPMFSNGHASQITVPHQLELEQHFSNPVAISIIAVRNVYFVIPIPGQWLSVVASKIVTALYLRLYLLCLFVDYGVHVYIRITDSCLCRYIVDLNLLGSLQKGHLLRVVDDFWSQFSSNSNYHSVRKMTLIGRKASNWNCNCAREAYFHDSTRKYYHSLRFSVTTGMIIIKPDLLIVGSTVYSVSAGIIHCCTKPI